jgi:hypothetical protein
MRKASTVLAAAFVALTAAFATVPSAASAAPVLRAYSNCASGDICFYTGVNGTGQMCAWDGNAYSWHACSWGETTNVRSVVNKGTGGAGSRRHVVYYHDSGYINRIGCTKQGVQGNLAGTYTIGSHKWVASC